MATDESIGHFGQIGVHQLIKPINLRIKLLDVMALRLLRQQHGHETMMDWSIDRATY